MQKKFMPLIIAAGLIIGLFGALFLVFISRAPVILVADASFAALYGRGRLEAVRSSVLLFRPVKPITMADDAGSDLVISAVIARSQRPYCVLFPLRFAEAARYYAQQFPDTPVILMEGRNEPRSRVPEGILTVQTDIETDFFMAGVFASIIDGAKHGRVAVFTDTALAGMANQAFLHGFNDPQNAPAFYSSFAQLSSFNDISCVVIAGAGAEFFQVNIQIPVIFFTWLYPIFTPARTVVIFDDSPWAQLIPSVKMVSAGKNNIKIPSKTLIFSSRIADMGILRSLKKAAKSGIAPVR